MTISKRNFLTGAIGLWLGDSAGATDEHEQARSRLLAEMQSDLRDTASTTGRRQCDPAVLAAIANVPRHRFVPPRMAAFAYSNRPLAIGHGQTISQPFIVALMTQLLDPKPTDRVLEIGTGSGYQAAVLSHLVARVYTIEIVRPLGERAAELLGELGHANVEVRIGDGYLGWPEAAPFDAVVVTAAPDSMPHPDRLTRTRRAAHRASRAPGRTPESAADAQGLRRSHRDAQRAARALRAAHPQLTLANGRTLDP